MQRLLAEYGRRAPEIRNEPIGAPIVVVGQMRSGTTLLQRLLATTRFYCAYGWEVGEPAPRPGTGWTEPDPRIPDGEARVQQMRDFAADLFAIHPMVAHEADEEIVFLADAFLSHVPEASCHVPAYRAWLDSQDFTPAYRYLEFMLQLLQWQKRRRGRTRALGAEDARASRVSRRALRGVPGRARRAHAPDPLETIPSGASLNYTLWKMYADAVDPAEVGRQWLERMGWTTARALAVRDRRPDGRALRRRLVPRRARRPDRASTRIYEQLGLELAPDARSAWSAGSPRTARSHRRTATPPSSSASPSRDPRRFAEYMARFIAPARAGLSVLQDARRTRSTPPSSASTSAQRSS